MSKNKQSKAPARRPSVTAPAVAPEIQELRALMRRVPDGLKATLQSLKKREESERLRLLQELARSIGKDALPLLRSAALSSDEDLWRPAIEAVSALKSRAGGDLLTEIYTPAPEGPKAPTVIRAAAGLKALGIRVDVPDPEVPKEQFTYRDVWISPTDSFGTNSIVARFQDGAGQWHAVVAIVNDFVGLRDLFFRPLSVHDWEKFRRREGRGSGVATVRVDREVAETLLKQSIAINREHRIPLPKEFPSVWEDRFGPLNVDEVSEMASVVDSLIPPDAGDDWWAAQQQFLGEHPFISELGWLVDGQLLRDGPVRWITAGRTLDHQQETAEDKLKRDSVIAEVTNQVWTRDELARYARRLEWVVRCYLGVGLTRQAVALAAESRRLATNQPPIAVPADDPLLYQMTRYAILESVEAMLRKSRTTINRHRARVQPLDENR